MQSGARRTPMDRRHTGGKIQPERRNGYKFRTRAQQIPRWSGVVTQRPGTGRHKIWTQQYSMDPSTAGTNMMYIAIIVQGVAIVMILHLIRNPHRFNEKLRYDLLMLYQASKLNHNRLLRLETIEDEDPHILN